MADYLSFADGVPISDPVSSDSEEDLDISGMNLDEEEPEVRFNDPSVDAEDLVAASQINLDSSRKCWLDDAEDEEEIFEGSGLFAKRPRISGCPNMKEWLIKNKKPASLQDPDIRDNCAESLHFLPDVERWTEYEKDNLPDAILGHFLEVMFLVFSFLLLYRYSSC